MELKRLSMCIAFVLLAVVSQCSEARHAIQRRATDDDAISAENMMADEGDYGTQNDADGGNDADEDEEQVTGIIVSKPDNYRLLIGRSVRLECKVAPADDNIVVSWSKEEEKIFLGKMKLGGKNFTRFSLAEGSSDLVIRDLELTDTGRYTCEILQKTPATITHVVIVEEPPRINNPETTTMENNIDSNDNRPRIIRFNVSTSDRGIPREGSDLLLTCDVTGVPRPALIWSRQRRYGHGTESLTEANGQFSKNTFFMKNVSKEDSGTYYCYAVSDSGNATAMLTINVIGKPRVHVHRPIVNTDIGIEAELNCFAHEQPAPYFRWYKDDRLIEDSSVTYSVNTNGSQSTLIVTPKKNEDFGIYTCEAANPHGTHRKSIELVENPVIENLDADGPKLTWTVHSHQPLEDIELHLRHLGGEGESQVIKVPLPDTKTPVYDLIYVLDNDKIQDGTYEATVKVKNNKDWSRHIDPAVVQIESQAQPIQTASVFRGASDDAHSLRPSTFALTTILMYLLVRML